MTRKIRMLVKGSIAHHYGRELRKLRGGRSQATAARLTGQARPNYTRAEKGFHEPTLAAIVRSVRALGGDPEAFVSTILRRVEQGRTVPATCSACAYVEGGECDHPDLDVITRPNRMRPGQWTRSPFRTTGDEGPPETCPNRPDVMIERLVQKALRKKAA